MSSEGGSKGNSKKIDKSSENFPVLKTIHVPAAKKPGKHTKFVPICSEATKGEYLLPGRHDCQCEATKHHLINNCIGCGRIVCEQEGSGPCFTCGRWVGTPEEEAKMESQSGFKLITKVMHEGRPPTEFKLNSDNLQIAVEHRDKLIEFDRNVEKRAKVIDDENDYFQVESNPWLTSKEKKILTEKREELHNVLHGHEAPKLTFDFAGKKIIEEKPEIKFNPDELLNCEEETIDCSESSIVDKTLSVNPQYVNILGSKPVANDNYLHSKYAHIRLQDREIQEMSDDGMCLSVRQPYASFLVAGIKTHEGRSWYTSYRGRVWIHAGAKAPSKREISDLQNSYRFIVGNCNFPDDYPTGCLLGCVDIVDCLPQEEYREMYPHGEICSAYVFICKNAQELSIKFPMKGDLKLFKLDGKIHQAAKNTLRKHL